MPRSVTLLSRTTSIVSASLLLTMAAPRPASAHDTWLLMKDYLVKPSAPATFLPISSHAFVAGAHDLMSQDNVASVSIFAPDGSEAAALAGPEGYSSPGALKVKGTYVALLKQQAGFYSKTPDGGVRQNKKEAPGAVNCRYSEKHAKSLFSVGGPGGNASTRAVGLPLEIVPVQDPATLKAGALLDVKVLFEGKPLASTVVFGTYAGFSDVPGTFAYTTSTNKEGVARIKLLKSGTWLLLAKREQPYQDLTVCDKQTYSGSLTFRIK